jgi:hypothetical protein
MKWYQFHLSTALLATLVAAVLLGINLTPKPPPTIDREDFEVVGNSYGWPSTWHNGKIVDKVLPPQWWNQQQNLGLALR